MKESKDIHDLLYQLSKNDEIAFRQIFRLFSNRVYSFSLRLTKCNTSAEEMVQEVFMKVWINRAKMQTVENFPSYLFIVTKNLILNSIKRNAIEEKAKAAFAMESVTNHSDTEEKVILDDYERILNETIDHLPPQQRLVYSMCHQEGLQYEEVAQRLKISRLTVKTHMHQALKTIKSQFSHIIQVVLLLILASL
jgi:RNA polymerase sigma-70 factor (family 1)